MQKAEILSAIRRAARELGRAPSRGELKRLTGVSHYRVLTEFRTLREAIRAAGLEPNKKGERVATEELIKDWERVRKKLGRRPSRTEYVREGRYSAGTFVMRFGSWSGISTTEAAKEHRGKARGSRESTRRTRIRRELPKSPELKSGNHRGHREAQREIGGGELKIDERIEYQWAARVPEPVEGKRRVTEAVAQLVVNTLLGDGIQPNGNGLSHPFRTQRGKDGAPKAPRIFKDRPVMGPPFSRHPLTNAPVNEMGVVFLFALVAWDLGFQVESLWGRGYPDIQAKREVAPGKWQDVAIEI